MRTWIRSIAAFAAVLAAPGLSAQAAKPATPTTPAPATQPAKAAPATGATSSAVSATAATTTAKVAATSKAPTKATLVDINRATQAELEALPGIGKALAPKIIAGRPYAKKSELVQKKVLNQATYDKVKDLIIARQ